MLSPRVHQLHAVASWVLVALGVAHGLGTLVDIFVPTFFAPSDPAVLDAMKGSTVTLGALLHVPLVVWSSHLGYNASHSLGIAFTGALQLALRRSPQGLVAVAATLPIAMAATAAWLVLSVTSWFWAPSIGFAFVLAALAVTWRALATVERPRLTAPPVPWLGVGTAPMGIAGALHFLGTFPDVFREGLFSPAATVVRRAMDESPLLFPAMLRAWRSTWRAYVGFNFSHGVAVTSFAASAIVVGRGVDRTVLRPVLVLFALASSVWLAIAIAFWFSAPAVVVGIALAAHVLALTRAARARG